MTTRQRWPGWVYGRGPAWWWFCRSACGCWWRVVAAARTMRVRVSADGPRWAGARRVGSRNRGPCSRRTCRHYRAAVTSVNQALDYRT